MSTALLALAVTLIVTARWFWRAWQVDVARKPTLFVAGWMAGLALGLWALSHGEAGGAAGTAVGLSLLMLYFSATGGQATKAGALAVGDLVPAFTGIDEYGAQFDSASLAGSRFLLKFFRGHW